MNTASRWFIMFGILAVLLLVGMIALFLSAGQTAPVSGQESDPPASTPSPPPSTPEPPATPDSGPGPWSDPDPNRQSRVEVTASWGTVVMTELLGAAPASGGTSGTGGTSGDTGTRSTGGTGGTISGSVQDLTQTPLTVADITPPQGGIALDFTYSGLGDSTVRALRIERATFITGPPETSGWVLLAEEHTTISRYADYSVPLEKTHVYRVTPLLDDGSELEPVKTSYFYPMDSSFISARGWAIGDEAGVFILVRSYPFQPAEDQRAVVKRYDHRERHAALADWTSVASFSNRGGLAVAVDTDDLTEGKVYYYTVEYSYQLPGSDTWVPVALPPVPVGVMAGEVAPPTPSAPTVTIDSAVTGKTTVSWSIDSNNRQASAYVVERRSLRPIERFSPVGMVKGTSMSFLADTATIDKPYEYRVRPFGLNNRRYYAGTATITPAAVSPVCVRVNRPDEDRLLRGVSMRIAQDLSGPLVGYSERSIDLVLQANGGNLCLAPDPNAFYLMRQLVTVHTRSEDCSGNESCDLPEMAEDDYRIMYGSQGYVWGFPRLNFVGFDDEPLPQGKYDIRYKVCVAGADKCSRGYLVRDVLVGVDSVPFTGNADTVAVNRQFPETYIHP